MILIVNAITTDYNYNHQQFNFHQETYSVKTKEELRKKIKDDFKQILETEINKINYLI